jgi:hypothetical protein
MKKISQWKKIIDERIKHKQTRSDIKLDNNTFAELILGDSQWEISKKIVICIREVIADEADIVVDTILPNDYCSELARLMGPATFFGYYFQPLFGWIGFDTMRFVFELEYKLSLRTEFSITFNKEACKTISTFDKLTELRLKEWILDILSIQQFQVNRKN